MSVRSAPVMLARRWEGSGVAVPRPPAQCVPRHREPSGTDRSLCPRSPDTEREPAVGRGTQIIDQLIACSAQQGEGCAFGFAGKTTN